MSDRGDRVRGDRGFQAEAGYSRAARRGRRVAVSGTTATGPDGAALHPGDTYRQARHALQDALAAVRRLGGSPQDVLRTRVYWPPARTGGPPPGPTPSCWVRSHRPTRRCTPAG
jgi:enamine deaminase RidA (YjgF/YER057c/UK114 family)